MRKELKDLYENYERFRKWTKFRANLVVNNYKTANVLNYVAVNNNFCPNGSGQ